MKKYYLKIIQKILATYARRVLQNHNPIIIGITGSVGKTSTKEAIYQVLSDEFGADVRKNFGNLNTEIGVPLTILGYNKLPNKYSWPIFLILAFLRSFQKEYPKYLILEMSIDKIGDMKYLTSIAQPNYVVITSTRGAHLEYFSNEEEYQKEKISILHAMKDGGVAVLNYDDLALSKIREDNVTSFAIDNTADYRAENVRLTLDGTEYRIICTGYKVAVKSQLLGKHLVYGQLAAFAIGDLLGISRLKIGKSLEKIKPMPGRMHLIKGKNKSLIIDDTYNSCNPTSVKGAVDLISAINYSGRKVVIIGNMNELGQNSRVAHEEVGEHLKGKCDLAIFVGKNAPFMAKAFGDNKKSLIFNTRDEVISVLPKILKEKDLILIKASQNGNYFEEITKAWMKDPQEAAKLLVRQDKFWKGKK